MISQKNDPQKNSGKTKKTIYISAIVIIVVLVFGIKTGVTYYRYIFEPNVTLKDKTKTLIFIPSDATFDQVTKMLVDGDYLKNAEGFKWVAKKKGYTDNVLGGCYTIKNNMTNNDLVNLLRSGIQTPVNVTFNNIRTLNQLAGHVAERLEPDSLAFVTIMHNSDVIKGYGFNKETFIAMFIPNTYEFYWTTTAKKFVDRMNKEYKAFWNDERLKKAKEIGLTPVEVSTLASIVDEETVKPDEKPKVAGLYLNRLKKGMKLQADPTIKFALGDFSVKRILNKDLKIDSPYNTYLYKGLPPGPIRIPSIQGIEAVLNYNKHNYLYMCAKDDFSGYHNFATTLKQHNRNAARYRKALRENKIWR